MAVKEIVKVKQEGPLEKQSVWSNDTDGEPIALDMTGCKNWNLAFQIIRQVIEASVQGWVSRQPSQDALDEQDQWMNASAHAYAELNPKDMMESMLAAQMVANHFASMYCFKLAGIPEQSVERRDANLKHAEKLSRIYLEQMAALNKHRGNGKQKVEVKHIHIHEGGQAIVGHIEAGGRKAKNGEQPHTKITYAPEQEMPCIDEEEDSLPVTRNEKR